MEHLISLAELREQVHSLKPKQPVVETDKDKIIYILVNTVKEWKIYQGITEEYPYNADFVASEIIKAVSK